MNANGLNGLRLSGNSTGPERSPFTIENIPYGVISTRQNSRKRCATAFEDSAVDLQVLEERAFFKDIAGINSAVFAHEYLNTFAALPRVTRIAVREKLIYLLSNDTLRNTLEEAFIPLSQVQNHYPMNTSNFSDFYCSLEHTKNCTEVFGKNTIDLNWFTAPMVYNGRTSSLVVSGTPITRPCGVLKPADGGPAHFAPSQRLDFELEMGFFLSKPLPRGQRVRIDEAAEHIFGFVLLNDWSARDIQVFEMPPLGPFHSKGFGTSISPWIVTREALELAYSPRATPQEPTPMPHLNWKDASRATFDIELSVSLIRNTKSFQVGNSNLKELHWTPYQQLAHLASAGEGLSTGDIIGTGTISSERRNEKGEKIGLGCIYERILSKNSLASINDIAETFINDGDEVVMEGWCLSRESGNYFGFGQCRGVVLPAIDIET